MKWKKACLWASPAWTGSWTSSRRRAAAACWRRSSWTWRWGAPTVHLSWVCACLHPQSQKKRCGFSVMWCALGGAGLSSGPAAQLSRDPGKHQWIATWNHVTGRRLYSLAGSWWQRNTNTKNIICYLSRWLGLQTLSRARTKGRSSVLCRMWIVQCLGDGSEIGNWGFSLHTFWAIPLRRVSPAEEYKITATFF